MHPTATSVNFTVALCVFSSQCDLLAFDFFDQCDLLAFDFFDLSGTLIFFRGPDSQDAPPHELIFSDNIN